MTATVWQLILVGGGMAAVGLSYWGRGIAQAPTSDAALDDSDDGVEPTPAVPKKRLHQATDYLTEIADVFDDLGSPGDAHVCLVLRGRLWYRPTNDADVVVNKAEVRVDE